MKIDMETECWFCRRKAKELIPIVNKLIEGDIEKETELKKKGHPYGDLLFSTEDIFDVISVYKKDLEFPICWICKEILDDLIHERQRKHLEEIIEKLKEI